MSNEVINPYQTFRDSAGQPLAAGTITFNDNLLTTKSTIYSDEALTVAQTNPYTLDAYGRIAGDVKYIGLKRLVIKTAAGGTVRTLDNVAASDGVSASKSRDFATLALAVASTEIAVLDVLNLAENVSGSGGGGFWDVELLSAGAANTFNRVAWGNNTGAATDLVLVLRIEDSTLNLAQIGAAIGGDLNATWNHALSLGDVAIIRLPKDTTATMSGNIVIPKAVRIDGAGAHGGVSSRNGSGPSATTVTCTAAGGAAITLDPALGGANTVANIHLSNFILAGNVNMTGGIALGTNVAEYIVCSSVRDVTVRDFTAVGGFGIWLRHVLQTHFENVFCIGNYNGWLNQAGDIVTTITTMNCYSGSNTNNGMILSGSITGCSFYEFICESNFSSALVMLDAGVSTNNFYAFYAEDNNRTLGAAPIEIGTSGTTSPIYINFFGGNIVSGDVSGLYISLDKADRINFYDFILPAYTAGFMTVTASTTTSRFRTFSSVLSTNAAGNHSGGMFFDYPNPKKKMATFTYDVSAAPGTTAVAGLGFEPSIINIMAAVDNTSLKSSGFSDGTLNYVIGDSNGTTAGSHGPYASACVQLLVDGSNFVRGSISAVTHDGFTITWTKTGSPTGSATVFYSAT